MKSQDPSPAGATGTPGDEATPTEIVTVRPTREVMSKQRLPYFFGVSEETSGARGLSMSLVVIPPGGSAEPHYHRGFETAIYILEGCVETRYGKGLRRKVTHRQGDFLFIPPGVPHQACQPQRPGTGAGHRGPQPSQRPTKRWSFTIRSRSNCREAVGGQGIDSLYEHGCTGCTGLTGREVAAPEAGSGDDPLRACGCPGLQASRFLKKSCGSCASMQIIRSNDARDYRMPGSQRQCCISCPSM